MSNLIRTLRGGARAAEISSLEDYAAALAMFNPYGADLFLGSGNPVGVTQTLTGEAAEPIPTSYINYARQAYKQNGIVFACMLARMAVFGSARFRWQRLRDGKPADTFGTTDLGVFERPWVGGTTQDFLGRMIQDADLAGNSFWWRNGNELVRLRPDWVDIVVEPRMVRGGKLGYRKLGYLYYNGGKQRATVDEDLVPFLVDEVAHFMPTPDPEASFRGMSWLTPVIREMQADGLMTRHKSKFFENGATPNMVIKHQQGADPLKVRRFQQMLDENYAGVENAYRTLNLYPGADLTVVGSNFQQTTFKEVQGAGETRIAAAAGVPPVIAGFSEGLEAATYSNYAQARRRFADGTIHPLWQNASGTCELLTPRSALAGGGGDVRLWYDVSDVPFLREDALDAANISQARATTIKTYIDAGFTPESAIAAVDAGDERLLSHTGLVSVQLQPPGQQAAAAGNTGTEAAPTQGAQA